MINEGTERERTTRYDASGNQSGAAVTRDVNGKIVYDGTITHTGGRNAIETSDSRKTVHGNDNKTPTPDAVNDSHVPAAVREVSGQSKSGMGAEKERKRKVTLPGEGRTQDRVNVNEKELVGAMVGKRTGDNSTPAPAETTTPGGSRVDKVQRKKLNPGDPRDDLNGGSTGTGGKPGRQPGGNEGASPSGDGSSSSSEGGSEPPKG